MSKPSSSRLTRSGKKRRAHRLTVDLRDALDTRLRKIEVVSCLLGACREEALLAGAVERAGELIGDEVRGMKALLERAKNLP